MNTRFTRRAFIVKGSGACMACCLMTGGGNMFAATTADEDPPDPDKFTYCGYRCTSECKLLQATLQDNPELKRKVYDEWQIAARKGIEFDESNFFCYGCKNEDKPRGIIVQQCTIIPCARKKGFGACFQCKELAECDKQLWLDFPKHREYVLDLQKAYLATQE